MTTDAAAIDRIDVRYAVVAKVDYPTPKGTVVIEARFSMTLGTYSGVTTPQTMAENVNARGIHEGDVESVACQAGAPSIDDATAFLAERGLKADDIVEMRIEAVELDGAEIASSFVAEPII